jgi:anti-anti-sigma regulatory factor
MIAVELDRPHDRTPGRRDYAVLRLDGDLDEAGADLLVDLCRQVCTQCAPGSELCLDVSSLTHIDGGAAWAVEAAADTARSRGIRLTLRRR